MLYIQVHIWNSYARCARDQESLRQVFFLKGQSKSDMSVILFLAGLCWKPRLLGILIAWVTKNWKVNKNLTVFKTKLPKNNIISSDNQSSSESRSILGVKAKIKAYQIVSNFSRIVRRIIWAFWTHTLCAWISSKCGVHGARNNLLFPTMKWTGSLLFKQQLTANLRIPINKGWKQKVLFWLRLIYYM